MNLETQKTLSAKLKQAMANEHLWSKDVAAFLNLIPTYISMMLNPKFFDKCGSTAWERLAQWDATGLPISEFKIPEGEKIRSTEKPEQVKVKPAKEKPAKKAKSKKEKDIQPEHKEVIPESTPKPEPIPGTLLETVKEEKIHLCVALDLEINLLVNGTSVKLG